VEKERKCGYGAITLALVCTCLSSRKGLCLHILDILLVLRRDEMYSFLLIWMAQVRQTTCSYQYTQNTFIQLPQNPNSLNSSHHFAPKRMPLSFSWRDFFFALALAFFYCAVIKEERLSPGVSPHLPFLYIPPFFG
jgi:hypothetical protein